MSDERYDFTNLKRIYQAHLANVWWIMKVFRLYCVSSLNGTSFHFFLHASQLHYSGVLKNRTFRHRSNSELWKNMVQLIKFGRDIFLLKPTLGPHTKFQYLTRAEEVVITRLRIGHTKATKSHILSRGPPTTCHHCAHTLTIDHMLLNCAALQEIRDEYYTADSLKTLFEKIPETCIVEFLREAGFFYLIWIVKNYKL